jgi:hypothetical protein
LQALQLQSSGKPCYPHSGKRSFKPCNLELIDMSGRTVWKKVTFVPSLLAENETEYLLER